MNLPTSKKPNQNKSNKNKPLRSIIRNEMTKNRSIKYIDTIQGYQTLSNSPITYITLSTIGQGTPQGSRVADTVHIQGVDYKMSFNQTTTELTSNIRFFIFRWNENTLHDQPAAGNVVTAPLSGPPTVYAPLCFETRKNYTLKTKDNLISLVGIGTSGTSLTTRSQVTISNRVKINNTRLDFTLGALTGTGHIYVLFYSDIPSTGNPPEYIYYFRLWYYDDD